MKFIDINIFSQKLKEFRLQAGLTQQKLAELINVSLKTVQRWEKGKRQPRMEDIRKLAQIFHTTEQELLSGVSKTWILTVKIADDFQEEVIDVNRNVPTVSSIITTPHGGYLCLGGDYSLWSNPENFKKLIRDLKKFQATVIQNGRALGGIKD